MPKPRQAKWGLRLLTVIAACLWLVTFVFGGLFLYVLPRFSTAAHAIRIQAGSSDADRVTPRPSNEQLIENEAVLEVAAAQAVRALAALVSVASVAILLTFILMSLKHRNDTRELIARFELVLSQLNQQGGASGGVERETVAGAEDLNRSKKWKMLSSVLLGVVLISVVAVIVGFQLTARAERQQLAREDSSLIQRMAEGSGSSQSAPQPGKDYIVPAVGLEMIWVNPGSFSMGGNGRYDEGRPITAVTLAKGFWLGKYKLTQGEYCAIMHKLPVGWGVDSNLPVFHMSWFAAKEYCRKLTEDARASGNLPERYIFTLPTEAQWEYASRAGAAKSAVESPADAAHSRKAGQDFWWLFPPAAGKLPLVGKGKPNAWGFYDMNGSPSGEWCLDWYAYELPGGSVTNPTGPVSGTLRVRRGSTHGEDGPERRMGTSPVHSTMDGMRVALSPDESR